MDFELAINTLNFFATGTIAAVGIYIGRKDNKRNQDYNPAFYLTDDEGSSADGTITIGVANNSMNKVLILKNDYKNADLENKNTLHHSSFIKSFKNDVVVDNQSHSELLIIKRSAVFSCLDANKPLEWIFVDKVTNKRWKVWLKLVPSETDNTKTIDVEYFGYK